MSSILIVDDQECIRELLFEELTDEGYGVAGTGSAGSVQDYLRFALPDVVILDLYLDGFDGFAILRDLKQQFPFLPVIIFTAYDTYKNDPRLSQADGYVVKSARLGKLKQTIAEVLEQRRMAEGFVEPDSDLAGYSVAHGY